MAKAKAKPEPVVEEAKLTANDFARPAAVTSELLENFVEVNDTFAYSIETGERTRAGKRQMVEVIDEDGNIKSLPKATPGKARTIKTAQLTVFVKNPTGGIVDSKDGAFDTKLWHVPPFWRKQDEMSADEVRIGSGTISANSAKALAMFLVETLNHEAFSEFVE